ncbi:Gldg family protein [Botrimarina sp.]|uniref:Gldg family protein n=1 Tax=Botrimarina sp. TaxID=2795802 RepID=UPI0032EF97E2
MNWTVLKAIFRRDFVSYFSNPTGYVFICVFVMLTSLAAFWPPEFFTNNLANLDQLSRWMPLILLAFIPAITMSIWAEERRQGTDELLLTMPATDFDVVMGKYKAAVAIFTVALLFSAFSVLLVFYWGLGSPDLGLFVGSYLGYWFVGLAMLAIGMVASFFTSNLTVGFILGALLNAPLALFGAADLIVKNQAAAQTIRQWSAAEQFADFERGVVSLSSVAYFVGIAAVMLYVSMVLISKRHWAGREDGEAKGGHYLLRALCLLVVVGAVNLILSNNDARLDITSQRINSLSDQTVKLVRDIARDDDVPPIQVDVFVNPQVPSEYAAQKRDLLGVLNEIASISGGDIRVTKHEIENFSESATLAERRFGIEAQPVQTKVRGAMRDEEVLLGMAFTCGLDKVVVPFVDKGIPVEYEVVRSIATVAQQERQRVGVLKTAVNFMGGFSMQGMQPRAQIIDELEKQYEVVEVDPSEPITDRFDVLLAAQPSSLGPAEMDNFVECVKSGQPVAIFEDPAPMLWQGVVGTDEPNPPQGGGMMGMFGGGQPGAPKGDISQLWNLLGVRIPGDEVIYQEFNPYPRADTEGGINPLWVFVDKSMPGAEEPFSEKDPIVSGLGQLLFFFTGAIESTDGSGLESTALATTDNLTGYVPQSVVQMMRQTGRLNTQQVQMTNRNYVIASHLSGAADTREQLSLDDLQEDAEVEQDPADQADADPGQGSAELNVVLVADVDCLSDAFFALRQVGQEEDALVRFNFQNVPFVLNTLDALAGDERFLEVRKRARQHRILEKIEEATEEYREIASDQRDEFIDEATSEITKARDAFREKIDAIANDPNLSPMQKEQRMAIAERNFGRTRDVQIAKLEKDRDRQIRQTERDLAAKIRGVQDFYKLAAVLIPPIPPILLAVLVYFHRREREREGVDKSRLRFGGKSAADRRREANAAAGERRQQREPVGSA